MGITDFWYKYKQIKCILSFLCPLKPTDPVETGDNKHNNAHELPRTSPCISENITPAPPCLLWASEPASLIKKIYFHQ